MMCVTEEVGLENDSDSKKREKFGALASLLFCPVYRCSLHLHVIHVKSCELGAQ